jgi:hypothetical protein
MIKQPRGQRKMAREKVKKIQEMRSRRQRRMAKKKLQTKKHQQLKRRQKRMSKQARKWTRNINMLNLHNKATK